MIFIYRCPVCQNAFTVECELSGWSGAEKLHFSVIVSEELKLKGDKILCSTDCYTVYTKAKVKANEAYDAIMSPFEGGGFDA